MDQELQKYSSDLGEWPTVIERLFQEFWITEGSLQCQNVTSDFSLSGVMYENEKRNGFAKNHILQKYMNLQTQVIIGPGCVTPPVKENYFAFPVS